jgi:hypothetical protein
LTLSRISGSDPEPQLPQEPPAGSRHSSAIFRRERFLHVIYVGLLLCAVLYAEEALHFLTFGWSGPDNDPWTREVTDCRAVPGSATDIDCPVRGYGTARYRYRSHQFPGHNDMVFIDRIE